MVRNDFIKKISVVTYDKNGLKKEANDVINIAGVEGLKEHALSVKIRVR